MKALDEKIMCCCNMFVIPPKVLHHEKAYTVIWECPGCGKRFKQDLGDLEEENPLAISKLIDAFKACPDI